MSLSIAQERALAILPKLTGVLGFTGSAIIIAEIVATHRRGRGNPILRALLGMSVFYLLDAFAWTMSTWLVPESSGFAFAAGSVTSCAFQGFWLQAVIAGPLYNAVMALYFYLVSCKDKDSDYLATIEKFIHGIVLLFALGTSFAFLGMNQYNHIGAVCWVNGSPPQCGHSTFDFNPDVACERGDYAWLYGMILFYLPLWICILLLVFFNASIYSNLTEQHSQAEAKWVAQQAFLYFGAFCITWAPSTVWSAMHYKSGGHFALDLMAGICEPLAGFWNLLIFLSNRPTLRKNIVARLTCQKIETSREVSGNSKRSKNKSEANIDASSKSKNSNTSKGSQSKEQHPAKEEASKQQQQQQQEQAQETV